MNAFLKTKLWALLILVSALPFTSRAKVYVETTPSSIKAYTDEVGLRGFHGCESGQLEEVPAYVFILLSRTSGKTDCKEDGAEGGETQRLQGGHWKEVSRQSSDENAIQFTGLGKGEYRVECLVGQPSGCVIAGTTDDFPTQSIVYLQEKSTWVTLGESASDERSAALTHSRLAEGELLVFPNPAAYEINIQLRHADWGAQTRIRLVDLLGRDLIERQENLTSATGFFQWTLDVGQFPAGTYLLVVSDDQGQVYQQKVLVHKD